MSLPAWSTLVIASMTVVAVAGCSCPAGQPPSSSPAAAGESQVQSSYTLCDGKRCMLTVEIAGNRQVPASVLFASMRSLQDFEFAEEALERDALMIAAIYYDRAYLSVKVAPPVITRTADAISVRFSIEEGSRYTIKSLEVYEELEGVKQPPLGGWKSAFKAGDPFRRRDFALELEWLRRIYQDEGYADVDAYPRTNLDEAHKGVAVIVPIVRGEVKSFGQIRIEGLARVPEELVRKEIAFREGERFSMTRLEKSLRHLRKIEWFDEVNISTKNGGPALVDVTIEVHEQKAAFP